MVSKKRTEKQKKESLGTKEMMIGGVKRRKNKDKDTKVDGWPNKGDSMHNSWSSSFLCKMIYVHNTMNSVIFLTQQPGGKQIQNHA